MKKTVLIIGCGDIALRTTQLLQSKYRLFGLFRNVDNARPFRAFGLIPIIGDLDHPESLKQITGVGQIVIHLAPPPSQGTRDPRTTHLLSALSKCATNKQKILPHQLVYISTSGVYGDCQGAIIDETRPLKPLSDRAVRRANAEKQIRQWGIRNQVPVSILRVPGIYAENRLPLKRIKNNLPAFVNEDDGYTNHIHADDLARIICATIHHGKPGRTYNTTDDTQMKMGDYFDLVADHFNLPHPPRIPRNQAANLISPAMLSFMNESRRISNTRMKKELHIMLQFPTVFDGVRNAAEQNAIERT